MAIAAIALTGCKDKDKEQKDDPIIATYKVLGVDSMKIVLGHDAYGVSFVDGLNKAVSKYAKVITIDEEQFAADIRAVVNQYNNRYVYGSFKLVREVNKQASVMETYTMQTQPRYYMYDYSGVTGPEYNVEMFQQSVIEAVAELDEADGQGTLTEDMVKTATQKIYDENKGNLYGEFPISYFYENGMNKVVTYFFVPTPIYKTNFDADHVACVKGYVLSNPFRQPLRNATTDNVAINIADSVAQAIDQTYFYSVQNSKVSLSVTRDLGATYSELKTYSFKQADFIIGMDSTNLRCERIPRVVNTVYTIMQDSLVNFAQQELVYNRDNVETIKACMTKIVKSYKQEGFYPDLEGTIKLLGINKDNTEEVLATIDVTNL